VRRRRKLLLRDLHDFARRRRPLRSDVRSDGAAPHAEEVPRPRRALREVAGLLRCRRGQLSGRRKRHAPLPRAFRRLHLLAGGAPLLRGGAVLWRTMPPGHHRHADLRQQLRSPRCPVRGPRGLLRRRLPRSRWRARLHSPHRTDGGRHLYGDGRCLRCRRAHLLRRHGLRVLGRWRHRLRRRVLVAGSCSVDERRELSVRRRAWACRRGRPSSWCACARSPPRAPPR
jgi:hypothetical protein